jgi:hypothetical protein
MTLHDPRTRVLSREIIGVDVSRRTLVHLPEETVVQVIGPEPGSPSLVRVRFGAAAVKVFSVDLYKRSRTAERPAIGTEMA